jgi:hypothetical protein
MDTPPTEAPDPCPAAELTAEDRDLLAYLSGNPDWRRVPEPTATGPHEATL